MKTIPSSSGPMTEVRIRLLGTFSVEVEGRPVSTLDAARLQSLLAFLLLERGVPRPRRRLAASFWPDSTDEQSQTNLRTLVHRLRRALPAADRFLQVGHGYLLWRDDPLCVVDVEQFEGAADEKACVAELEYAIGLYRGDLLPGCYDDWIEPERHRLRRLYARTLDRLVDLHEAGGRYAAALEYARHRIEHDPLHEEGHRRSMRLHALMGDRAGALRAYRACEATLRDELGTAPDALTRDVYLRLQQMRDPEGAAGLEESAERAGPALVGREDAWRTLQDAWRDLVGGGPRVVVLTGEAGIGKTRLAEEFARWTERQGIATSRGRAYRLHGGLVFAPIIPWVRAGLARAEKSGFEELWLTELARVVPELLIEHPGLAEPPPISETGHRERFFEALARAVLLPRGPLLLVLDDLHWCESDALAWLHFLIRFDRGARVLLLLTCRTDDIGVSSPSSTLLLELRRAARLTEIELGPLDAGQSALLVGELMGPGVELPMASVYSVAEGNPLFIIEMVRARLAAEPPAREVRSIPAQARPPFPPTVQAVIQERLERLGSDARALVDAAAVIGRHFDLELVARVSGTPRERVVRAVDELCAHRILIEQPGDRFDFHHELVRDVAYAALGGLRRRHLHRDAAEALPAEATSAAEVAGEIAVHYDRAGMAGPAMHHYLKAARRTFQVGATSTAISALERALALSDAVPAPADTALPMEIREQLGDLLHVAGRYGEARGLFELVLDSVAQPIARVRAFRKIAKTRTGQRDFAAALEMLREARDLLDAGPDRGPDWWNESVQISLDRMGVLYWTTDWREIEEVQREIGDLVDRYGTPAQRRQRRTSLVGMMLRRDRHIVSEEMVVLARENVRSAMEEGHVATVAVARFQLASMLLWAGGMDDAEEELLAALKLAEGTSDRTLASRCLTYLAVLYRMRDMPMKAREYAGLALGAATALNNREYVGAARANQAWLSWRQKRYAEALEHGRAALAEWKEQPPGAVPFPVQWLALWPLIAVALASRREPGRLEEAVDHARRLLHVSQARLPEEVAASLEEAIRESAGGNARDAERHLVRATDVARQAGYL